MDSDDNDIGRPVWELSPGPPSPEASLFCYFISKNKISNNEYFTKYLTHFKYLFYKCFQFNLHILTQ